MSDLPFIDPLSDGRICYHFRNIFGERAQHVYSANELSRLLPLWRSDPHLYAMPEHILDEFEIALELQMEQAHFLTPESDNGTA